MIWEIYVLDLYAMAQVHNSWETVCILGLKDTHISNSWVPETSIFGEKKSSYSGRKLNHGFR